MDNLRELAERAFRAIAAGDEPPERLTEFLMAAQPRLANLLGSRVMGEADRELLAGISLVLTALTGATMRPSITKRWIEIKGSKANTKHSDTLLAAKLVIELEQDRKLESALQEAMDKYGIGRAALLEWRTRIKRDADLLSEIDELQGGGKSDLVGE